MTMRVLMIGLGKDVIGGITALVKVSVPVLENRMELSYFTTLDRRPLKESGHFSAKNILLGFLQYVRFIVVTFRPRPQIIHCQASV